MLPSPPAGPQLNPSRLLEVVRVPRTVGPARFRSHQPQDNNRGIRSCPGGQFGALHVAEIMDQRASTRHRWRRVRLGLWIEGRYCYLNHDPFGIDCLPSRAHVQCVRHDIDSRRVPHGGSIAQRNQNNSRLAVGIEAIS
jgi:hypothetical protein